MSGDWLKVVGVAVGFVALFGTGFWLSHAGRPYGQALFTVHKLVAVAILVFIVWSAVAANRLSPLGAPAWVVVSLAGLAFVALIASGGVLSAMETPPAAVRFLHKVAPYASLLLSAAWMFLRLKAAV